MYTCYIVAIWNWRRNTFAFWRSFSRPYNMGAWDRWYSGRAYNFRH